MLEVENLYAAYGESEVLHGVSLRVETGDFVAVLGANTAGKSTLLRSISRLMPRTKGKLYFDGQDLTSLKAHQLAECGIAHVPEGRHIFPEMSVQDNLLLGGYAVRRNRRKARTRLCYVPATEGASQTDGRHSVGWRATDGGHRTGLDDRTQIVATG